MPTLSNGKNAIEVKSGQTLVDAGENLGVPFSCTEGNCGTCLSNIESGGENLSPLTDAEKEFGLADNERLLCQATIQSGTVVVEV